MRHGLLSRRGVEQALDALAGELQAAGVTAELHIVGGAALTLLFDGRPSTRDIDACRLDPDVAAAAERVAARLDLDAHWLNDEVARFTRGVTSGPIVFERPALVVRSVSFEQLLAMKLAASRDDQDIADAALLLDRFVGSLPRTSLDRELVWLALAPYVPTGCEPRARETFDDLWDQAHGPG